MRNVLSVLAIFPGVTDISLLQPGKKSEYRGKGTTEIQHLSVQVAMLFSLGGNTDVNFNSVRYTFDHCTVVGLLLGENSVLVFVCEPRTNISLLINVARKLLVK